MTTATQSSAPGVNVDQAEVEKFSALAARWWDPESEFKPLHAINPLRLGWIQETAGSLSGKRVLDMGCGGGILSESMAVAGAQVTGIDLAEKSLKIARLHGLESGVKVDYRAVPVEELAAEQPGQYDVVTCMEMLEHVPDPASVVRACAALAKPGGWVFFSTLNRNPKSFLFAIVGAEYVLRLLPRAPTATTASSSPANWPPARARPAWNPRACAAWSTTPLPRSIRCRPTPRSTT